MPHFLDEIPFNWSREESQELRRLLSEAYNETKRARQLTAQVKGLQSTAIVFDSASFDSWTSIITEANKQRTLRVLVEEVLKDNLVVAFHSSIRVLIDLPNLPETTATPSPSPQSPVDVFLPNPYTTQEPAVPPNFVGRKVLLRELEEGILLRAESFSLVGDWRIGKSSVLATLEQVLQEKNRTTKRMKGEGKAGNSLPKFVRALTGKEIPNDADEAANAIESWAERVGQPGCPPVVLVDEAESLMENFEPRFFSRLRAMIEEQGIVLVLSSRRKLSELYRGPKGTFTLSSTLRFKQLGLFEEEAAETIIARGEKSLRAEDAALMKLWAGRHPFFLQLLGSCLINARTYAIEEQDWKDRFYGELDQHLTAIWASLNNREQEELRQAANNEMPTSQPSLRTRGLVTSDGKPFGKILIDWIKRNYP